MCVIGFVNSEGITLIGGATFIAALIDLGFFLYIDYCDIKRVSIICWLSVLYALNGRKVTVRILIRYEKVNILRI